MRLDRSDEAHVPEQADHEVIERGNRKPVVVREVVMMYVEASRMVRANAGEGRI